MSVYTSLIFNNVPFITPHLESQYLSEKVISAAVAIHEPHFKSGIVLEHVGLLVTTASNHTFLIHSCPVPPAYGTIIDLFTPDLCKKYRFTNFYLPKDDLRVHDFYVTCGGDKKWGWGIDKSGTCTDSVWRMLEALFCTEEKDILKLEWAKLQKGNWLSRFLTSIFVDVSYFWIMKLYYGNKRIQ
ncbi:9228_t:CDS:1 [Dentiscutata erythropus]|uniref:9228_t:CDS:1 n=1 Tax=Dentiscutata erythropus TaxID=1348616 RepID=A0A9N9A7V1_9GLOM|nr:9228_t:CDS:1 [Dentiscutata erythropus]